MTAAEPAQRRPSHSHHSRVGELVDGRYRIDGVLGRGAWSVVYDAVNERTGQQVALKMLLRNLPGGDASAEARFVQEAQIMASLQHPNTLRIFDIGRTPGGALYIAAQRLFGPTLEHVLQLQDAGRRPLSPAELAPILEALLGSLAEAHDKGLVHRDVKPGNVMLHEVGGERFVKVLDFGIAMWVRQAAQERGQLMGTPDAMSPEQCADQELDARTDLYAVAALAFRALAGRPVFLGVDVDDVLRQHREVAPPDVRMVSPQPISDALAAWVARGLAKHPKDRFQDARAMREALRQAMTAATLPSPAAAVEAAASAVSTTVTSTQHRASSWRIPALMPEVVTLRDTGTWRVERREPVGAAEQLLPEDAALPRSTAKYGVVDAAALAEHRARLPVLQQAAAATEATGAGSDRAEAATPGLTPTLKPTSGPIEKSGPDAPPQRSLLERLRRLMGG